MSAVFANRSDRLLTQLALNAVSVLARLLAGVVLFVFMARQMGPSSFGQFMYAMSLAALLAFPASLGFGQQVLREVAAHPARAESIVAAISSAKLTLTLGVILLVGLAALTFTHEWLLIALLTWVALADSFTEYLFCVLRAKGRYAAEAGFMTAASIVHFGVVLVGLTADASALSIGALFALSKGLQALACWLLFRRLVPGMKMIAGWREQWSEIRSGLSYAGDVAVSTLSAQVDTIIVKHTLGVHAAGLYQSGMRLLVGLQNFSVVAGNVFIPKLAAQHHDRAKFAHVATQARWVFGGLGVGLAIALSVGGWLLIHHGYGEAYEPVLHLLPWLATLIAFRLFAAGLGVQLTALGDQRFRTVVNLSCLVLMVAALWVGCVEFGLEGAVGALLLVIVVVYGAYAGRLRKLR